ncbi:bifunctional metallophosphatase/5'-nucleotidase, partial [bacterium]|nr:bifunctional metallophosphatase/5'-nucleotidase [bacterium]
MFRVRLKQYCSRLGVSTVNYSLLLPVAVPIVFLLAVSSGWSREIHILHYNDFHVNNSPRYTVDEDGDGYYRGGAANLKGLVDSLRTVYSYDLLVNTGDDFQGSPISGFTRGGSQVAILNAMGVEFFCPGNHEFDYGDLNLLEQLAPASFYTICCNVTDDQGRLYWPAYHIIELGGLRLGIIGVITAGLPELVVKENLEHSRVLEPVEEIRRWLRQLEDETDLQLLLSHSGYRTDSLYAVTLPGIDAIIGGHSHTELPQGRWIGNTLVVQAGCCGNWLGDLLITIDDTTGAVTLTDWLHEVGVGQVTPAADMQLTVKQLADQLPAELSEVIGQLAQPWLRERGESNVGDWTADVMRTYAATDLGFMNLGGLRRNLPAGEITRLDIWEVHPFGNHYVTFEMTGQELLMFLQRVARDELNESFAFSGMEFSIHQELGVVSRILIDGESLILNRSYTAVTNNFIFSHLEEIFTLDPALVNARHLPELDRDVIIQAVREQQTVTAV